MVFIVKKVPGLPGIDIEIRNPKAVLGIDPGPFFSRFPVKNPHVHAGIIITDKAKLMEKTDLLIFQLGSYFPYQVLFYAPKDFSFLLKRICPPVFCLGNSRNIREIRLDFCRQKGRGVGSFFDPKDSQEEEKQNKKKISKFEDFSRISGFF